MFRPESIQSDGNDAVKGWFLYNYATVQHLNGDPSAKYRSAITMYRFDCVAHTIGTLDEYFYEGINGSGAGVAGSGGLIAQMRDIPPNTDWQSMEIAACKQRGP